MKKTSPVSSLILVLILLLPILFTLYIYPTLPETIPTHFKLSGEADGFGQKKSIWFLSIFLTVVAAGVYLLISYLPKIDPKKTAGQSPELLHKIAVAQLVFVSAINMLLIYATKAGSLGLHGLLLPLMGLFFTVLGNYMYSIKPNYFVGFRTPWTLENEDNWRKTHQLVGKIWVPGGILITISTLLLPSKIGFIVFLSFITLMVLVPVIYSYRYFKTHQVQ